MSENQPKFYLTTPIYYVNARPHIGHAYTTIVADVLARRHRLLGDDTLFLTGTDEHGQKIERSAAAAGIPPQEFTDHVSAEFKTLWDRMGLTYDKFIRTTDPEHKRGAQKLFQELYDRGYIYLSTYTGSYCVSDEAFVDLHAGSPCPDCGRPLETVTEENFFFKLSEFQLLLLNLIESNELRIEPATARNEVLSFLRGNASDAYFDAIFDNPKSSADKHVLAIEKGYLKRSSPSKNFPEGNLYVPGALKDLSVSRSSFSWGILVPSAVQQAAGTTQPHVIYVWLDALANYMTAIGYGSDHPERQAEFQHYWPADLHLVGKEITRFHCVYWPAFLLAAGLPTPKQITANGWLLFDNAKMSKSRGNVVRTETILDAFGDHVYGKQFPESTKQERDLFAADVLRYFLLREIPFGQDGSFSFETLVTRYNADLANGYGNLVSRTLKMVEQYFSSKITDHSNWGTQGIVLYEMRLGWKHYFPSMVVANTKLARLATVMIYFEREATLSARFSLALDTSKLLQDMEQTAELEREDRGALDYITLLITQTDAFISAGQPWKLAKSELENDREKLRDVLYQASESIRIITALLYPFLPFATAKVWSQLGLGDIERAARNGELNNLEWGGLKPGTKLGPLAPIFPRADKGLAQIMLDMEEARNAAAHTSPASPLAPQQNPSQNSANSPLGTEPNLRSFDPAAPPRTSALAESSGTLTVGGSRAETPTLPTTPGPYTEAPASGAFASTLSQTPVNAAPADAIEQIGIDDFMRVELRVAQVSVAERIPKADKLLRLEVDLGYEKRQILSGIAQWYAPEELIGRRIVIVANLAPRKMRGLESHGMLLAASEGADGKPVLATFGEEIALGSRVR